MNNYLKYDEFVKKHCIEHAVMNGMRIGEKGFHVFGKSRPENGGILMSKLNKLKNKKELSEFDKEYIKRIMNYNKGDEENIKNRDDYDAEAFGQSIFYEEATNYRFSFNIFEPQSVIPSNDRYNEYLFNKPDNMFIYDSGDEVGERFDLMERGLDRDDYEYNEEYTLYKRNEEEKKQTEKEAEKEEKKAIKAEKKAEKEKKKYEALTPDEKIAYNIRAQKKAMKEIEKAEKEKEKAEMYEKLTPEHKIIFDRLKEAKIAEEIEKKRIREEAKTPEEKFGDIQRNKTIEALEKNLKKVQKEIKKEEKAERKAKDAVDTAAFSLAFDKASGAVNVDTLLPIV